MTQCSGEREEGGGEGNYQPVTGCSIRAMRLASPIHCYGAGCVTTPYTPRASIGRPAPRRTTAAAPPHRAPWTACSQPRTVMVHLLLLCFTIDLFMPQVAALLMYLGSGPTAAGSVGNFDWEAPACHAFTHWLTGASTRAAARIPPDEWLRKHICSQTKILLVELRTHNIGRPFLK
jgi:hypothetical protein